jgi:glyoxylase I family protein
VFPIESLHHVSLPVSDLERARHFYSEVLGLRETTRPPFDFPGAWYAVGERTLHLIVGDDQTFRRGKSVDSRDAHFAIRVTSFRQALAHLEAKGYRAGHQDPLFALRINIQSTAGFPQIYVMDPDRNVVEINAAAAD